MLWHDHSREVITGSHAFLSPSQYSWLRYDKDKLLQVYSNRIATQRGTELHDFARHCIELKQRLPRTHQTLNMYVNDAIGFGMSPEVTLYYSPFCFGTADSISFKKNYLRIHDLKTGVTPASMDQLLVYAALFCLDYEIRPGELAGCELRIYQNDDVHTMVASSTDILPIMDKIISFTDIIGEYKESEYGT